MEDESNSNARRSDSLEDLDSTDRKKVKRGLDTQLQSQSTPLPDNATPTTSYTYTKNTPKEPPKENFYSTKDKGPYAVFIQPVKSDVQSRSLLIQSKLALLLLK